ncbi:unnamed protein product [Auanema sp. JU1783]|nr:unnamed protein product [Auanema sp. JU1783]
MFLGKILLLTTATFALTPGKRSSTIQESIYVGQIYQKDVSAQSTVSIPVEENLPKWLIVANNTLQGIPSKNDIGKHSITIKTGSIMKTLEIDVKEDDSNPCGEQATTWLEVIYADDMDLAKRLFSARYVAQLLKEDIRGIRLYDFKYSREIRQVEYIGGEEDGAVVIIKPHCDGENEAIESATDDMDKLLDDDDADTEYAVTLTQGHVLSRNKASQGQNDDETTTVRTTTSRTTRHASDRPPSLVNSMNGFTCIRGIYCEALVPSTTFIDTEDGDTFNLKLSVFLLDGDKNWLYYNDKKIQGVPMKVGEYQFRLDARDKRGQMISAPFAVTVRDSPEHNHLVTMALDLTSKQNLASDAKLLVQFVKQLATVTKSKNDAVIIEEIKKEATRTVVKWSNNTLPYKTCSESGIEDMKKIMFTKQRKQMNRQFERDMTERFNVRSVNLELLGNCLSDNLDTATTVPSIEAAQESSFPWMILLAVLAVFLIVVALLTLLCTKKKVKKEKPSEFTGKGHPVVFPQEVGDDHDMDHATTPMLTKEERPPLKVSQHDNPLYKPPPPLATNSPRLGSVTSTIPNQKMPPPYVPP